MVETLQKVDHAALRVNQGAIIVLLLIGFVTDIPAAVAIVAAVMAYGAVRREPGFKALYLQVLRPRGLVTPDVLDDNPEPHVFAQGFGAVVLLAGSAAFLSGAALLGWALAWLVMALAGLNVFGGFCAGCAVYYWLNRVRVPGFGKAPPAGVFPGMRPRSTE